MKHESLNILNEASDSKFVARNLSGKVKCELRVQIYKLHVQVYELRVQTYELRVQIYELLFPMYKFKH